MAELERKHGKVNRIAGWRPIRHRFIDYHTLLGLANPGRKSEVGSGKAEVGRRRVEGGRGNGVSYLLRQRGFRVQDREAETIHHLSIAQWIS
jgi:hypothetical protein